MESLYSSFCKVEFVCYQGEPNWLGWLILLPLFGFFLYTFLTVVFSLFKVTSIHFIDIISLIKKKDKDWNDKLKIVFSIFQFIFFGIILVTILFVTLINPE